MKKITIWHTEVKIELAYSLLPLILAHRHKEFEDYSFTFFNSKTNDHQSLPESDIIILCRIFNDPKLSNSNIAEICNHLKNKCKRLIYFDDQDGSDGISKTILDNVHLYWKKQILEDLSLYTIDSVSRHPFGNYFSERHFPTESSLFREKLDLESLSKLRLAWNLGIGLYPTGHNPIWGRYMTSVIYHFLKNASRFQNIQLVAPICEFAYNNMLQSLQAEIKPKKSNSPLVSARFTHKNYPPTIGAQRLIFNESLQAYPQIKTGFTSFKNYYHELNHSTAVISPFGWGEVCFRDFEAVLAGSLLIKPSMGHLRTWPDIYSPECSYLISWDGSDLDEVLQLTFENHINWDIVQNARIVYRKGLEGIFSRLHKLLEEACLEKLT